ncbi:MAG: nucleotide exchange factor GrpE, partial [Methanomicrobiales archaeon]
MANMNGERGKAQIRVETGDPATDSGPVVSEQATGQDLPAPDTGTDGLREELKDLNEKYLRLAADFDNYRKRTERDIDTHIRYAIEKFAVELIEVIDNFDRAITSQNSGAREGLEQISKLFRTLLEQHGITPVVSVGEKFNPAEHEAVVCI